jgi:SAM-dependent methyltransferase
MVGDIDEAFAGADAYYDQIELPPGQHQPACDLGCGHGVYTVPLARRGYRVRAIDTSPILLDELRAHAAELPVEIIQDDLLNFRQHLAADRPSVIACMGDTLTHLESWAHVERLISEAATALAPQGSFIVSLRDYTGPELAGTDRFIPVRSDESRVHTCFIEYETERVIVHDVVHTKTDSGWQTQVSAYPKLRLDLDLLIEVASRHGLILKDRRTSRGMVFFCFVTRSVSEDHW